MRRALAIGLTLLTVACSGDLSRSAAAIALQKSFEEQPGKMAFDFSTRCLMSEQTYSPDLASDVASALNELSDGLGLLKSASVKPALEDVTIGVQISTKAYGGDKRLWHPNSDVCFDAVMQLAEQAGGRIKEAVDLQRFYVVAFELDEKIRGLGVSAAAGEVAAYRNELVEVTGISAGATKDERIVEYSYISKPTPVGVALSLAERLPRPGSKVFKRYDDGWRLVQGTR